MMEVIGPGATRSGGKGFDLHDASMSRRETPAARMGTRCASGGGVWITSEQSKSLRLFWPRSDILDIAALKRAIIRSWLPARRGRIMSASTTLMARLDQQTKARRNETK